MGFVHIHLHLKYKRDSLIRYSKHYDTDNRQVSWMDNTYIEHIETNTLRKIRHLQRIKYDCKEINVSMCNKLRLSSIRFVYYKMEIQDARK